LADFAVLGCGSWGTALATVLNTNKHNVAMWDRNAEFIATLKRDRVNEKYLPGAVIGSNITFTDNLQEAVSDKHAILIAVPSHGVRAIVEKFPKLSDSTILISAAKGIEGQTLMRVSQILSHFFQPDQITILAGPSHAEEVSNGIPTLVVSASTSEKTATWVQEAFMTDNFRVYKHHDVCGVELGGALKNVVAVAAGIIDGVGAGDNTKAALITRGLAEITRLGVKLGAEQSTFAGLTGMGDLIVTCMSKYSRNRRLGELIGQGLTLDQALSKMTMVAEGVRTTKAALQLSEKHEVEVPIIHQAYQVLFDNKNAKQAVFDLMTREAKVEIWE